MLLRDINKDPWLLINATLEEVGEALDAEGCGFAERRSLLMLIQDLRDLLAARLNENVPDPLALQGVNGFIREHGIQRINQVAFEAGEWALSSGIVWRTGPNSIMDKMGDPFEQVFMRLGIGRIYRCERCGKVGHYTGTRPRRFCSNRCHVADFRARAKGTTAQTAASAAGTAGSPKADGASQQHNT